MRDIATISYEELAPQREYMQRISGMRNRPKTYHIVTLGCQMNERDSELLAGMLEQMGMRREEKMQDAITKILSWAKENCGEKKFAFVVVEKNFVDELGKYRSSLWN